MLPVLTVTIVHSDLFETKKAEECMTISACYINKLFHETAIIYWQSKNLCCFYRIYKSILLVVYHSQNNVWVDLVIFNDKF